MESKKKNIINNETEAPIGKHTACVVSIVWKVAAKNKNQGMSYQIKGKTDF